MRLAVQVCRRSFPKKAAICLGEVGGRLCDYYHDRFTGISAPRSSACLSEKFECAEVVYQYTSTVQTERTASRYWHPPGLSFSASRNPMLSK